MTTMTSKLRIMPSEFEVSKGEKAPDCSRAKGAEAGDNKWKESKADRSVEICVFSILDLLLLNKARSLYLVLISAFGWSPGAPRADQRDHLYICNSFRSRLTADLVIDQVVGS